MKNILKSESGISGLKKFVLLFFILILLIAIIALAASFVLGNNDPANLKEKNPNIKYANNSGIVTVYGKSPDEVYNLIGEIRQDGCFNQIELGARYDPKQDNFYASVYISMEKRCIKKYS